MSPARVLVIDDDPMQLDLLSRSLGRDGFEVDVASSMDGARQALAKVEPDVALVDVNLPGVSSDTLASLIRDGAHGRTRFLLFSAWEPSKLRSLARDVGAHGWLSKSTPLSDIAKQLRAAMAEGTSST